MDADAKKQAARAVWEGKVSYSVALSPVELDQVLSELDSGQVAGARARLRLYLNRSFEAWYLAHQQAALMAAKEEWA